MDGFILKHPQTGREFFVVTEYINDNKYHGVKRANPKTRKYLVAHHTAGSTAGDLAVLRGKTSIKVSVKYLIADPQDGDYKDSKGRLYIYMLLPHDVIGWSVGKTNGTYAYVNNSNSDSIEVSNRGNGNDTFEGIQVEAFEAIVAYEERRLEQDVTVFAHKEIAPARKNDTHKSFPLARVKAWAKKVARGVFPYKRIKVVCNPNTAVTMWKTSDTEDGRARHGIKNGTIVTLLKKGVNMSKVSYDGSTGYIFNRYLDF